MSRRQPDALAGQVGHGAWSQMVWTDGKTGRTDSNRDGSATNRNREPVGKLARAWRCAMHLGRGPSRPDAMPSANMVPGGPKFANRRLRTKPLHARGRPARPSAMNDALGASVELGRNRLCQGSYLRDLHS